MGECTCGIFECIYSRRGSAVYAAIGIFATVVCVIIFSLAMPSSSSSSAEQRSAGRLVLNEVPLIDGHNDLPYNLYRIEHNRLAKIDLRKNISEDPVWSQVNDPASHTDIPRLRAGKVGAQFWVAYSSCTTLDKDAVALTIDQIDVIKRMISKYSDTFEYVETSQGIMEAFKKGKIGSLIAVEGGHSVDNRMAALRMYYELGARYMTLTHTCTLPWADASPVDANETITKRGLSEFGRQVVREMNRLGMMVDLSHVSRQTMLDALNATRAPVIFSHSNAWTVFNHHRNVQDDVLDLLKENQGIIMVNFYPDFLGNDTMEKVIEHLNYIKERIGIAHVGIGADFDGVPKTLLDLKDVSYYPHLFDRLAETGWTASELKQLAGLNFLRVFKAVEGVRDSLATELPNDDIISLADLTRDNPQQGCRSDLPTYAEGYLPPEVKPQA